VKRYGPYGSAGCKFRLRKNRQYNKKKTMSKIIRRLGWLGALILLLAACAPSPSPPPQQLARDQSAAQASEMGKDSPSPATNAAASTNQATMQLPVRFQRPNYVIDEPEEAQALGQEDDAIIKVGADISSTTGPVPLRDIMKRLAALKKMNVSWASDVDQFSPVDVDIRADEDFFKAIDHLLRQVDYFHEVQGNTIIVKYKETKRFHLAMPFLASTYNTGVGGDVLGSAVAEANGANVVGNLQLTSEDNKFDIWDNIKTNLDQILEIWSEAAPQSEPTADGDSTAGKGKKKAVHHHPVRRSGKGYYSIDKPIGLITVTAPRPLVEKVASYLENLKKQLYRQVSIEAKILEVTLNDSSQKGINWTGVLSNIGVNWQLFGPNGIIYSADQTAQLGRVIQQIQTSGSHYPGDSLAVGPPLGNPFTMVLNALEQQGRTKVLANPKISVMNGQPALISVGTNVRFIDKIESQANEGGVVTSTVTTASIMSGLGLSVVPTIMDDNEIILNMSPVTSQLQEPIQSVAVGQGSVMLPRVRLREMNSTVRIKDGGMLVVGGLIDQTDSKDNVKVPILGDLPLVNKLFKSETKDKTKTELVILLRPQII
jgi:MSHA type pilus biogenesis protein MshL